MSTTTKNPTLDEVLAVAEREHRERSIETLAELAAASETLADLDTAIEDAEDHESDVRGALGAGDPETTAVDLTAAKAEVEASRERLTGARRRLERLRRANVNVQTDAALAVVPVLHRALPMVPVFVISGTEIPKEVDLSETPVVVVRQVVSSSASDGEVYTVQRKVSSTRKIPVEVQVKYFSSVIHRPLDTDGLKAEIRDLDAPVNLRSSVIRSKRENQTYTDDIKLEVYGPAPVPAIIDPELTTTAPAALALAKRIGDLAPRGPRWVVKSTTVSSVDGFVDEGIRTVTVTGVAVMEDRMPGREADQESRPRRMSDLVGAVQLGLGRITDLQQTTHGDDVRWTATLVSRTDWDVTHPEIERPAL